MTSARHGAARGERKFAVALFADLSGFTALCRRLDPEDVALTVAPLMMLLRGATEAEGGVVANVAGDGFFAMFGVPVSLADAPARAIRSAEAMCAIVANRNAQPGLQRVPDVHVGIAAGEVLVTESDEPIGWSVLGNAVNLASRLCGAAGPGEVLVDEECRRLASAVTWAASRTLDVRGHDDDVTAWLLGSGGPAGDTSMTAAPYVGRAAELTQLDRELDDVCRTLRSRVLRISGQPGIGKTALVRRWLSQHPETRHRWLSCGGVMAGQSLGELLTMLNDLSGILDPDPGSHQPDSGLAHNMAAVVPDRFPQIVITVRRQLALAAAAAPLILVIDDLPRSDPSLAQLIDHIVAEPIEAPVVIVSMQRTDESSDPAASDIDLHPLGPDEVDDLLEGLLGAHPPESVRDAIARRAQGYPLMAVQSAAYLLEAGVLAVTDGACEVLEPHAVESLPTSLRMFIEARLDRLPANEKTAVQELSTVGESTDTMWASAVLGRDAGPLLEDLRRRGLLRFDEDQRWRFAHGLVQEVSYSTLTRLARTELHLRQLRLLAADAPPELRAYHALARFDTVSAGDTISTAEAATAAMREVLAYGQRLYATQANSCHAALEAVRGLISTYSHLSPDDAARLLVLDARCLMEIGRHDDALLAASRAVDVAKDHVLPERLLVDTLLVRGKSLSELRRFESARQQLDEAAVIADRLDDDALRAQALYLTGQTWRASLFSRFVSLTEAAYYLFVSAGDDVGAGDCARMAAYLHSVGPQPRFERWHSLAAQRTSSDDIRGRAWLARSLSMATAARYDFALSQSSAEDTIGLGDRAGAIDIVVDGLIDRVGSSLALGRIDDAIEAGRRLTSIAARQGNPRLQVSASATFAHALLRGGQQARSLEELAVAREALAVVARNAGHDAPTGGAVASAEAVVWTASGRWRDALESLDQAEMVDGEVGFLLLQFKDRIERLRLLTLLGTEVEQAAFTALHAECLEAGAPLIASFVAAVADLAAVLAGMDTAPSDPATGVGLEEIATRAETAALRMELSGADAAPAWAEVLRHRDPLGFTVWLARAQARCGDLDAATHTLDVLDSPAEARAWALSDPAG